MSKEYIVRKQVILDASTKDVWHALTNPQITKKYFFKSEVHSDWTVGSSIIFVRKIFGIPFKLRGEIKKIEPEKLLQYTLTNTKLFGKADPSEHSLVTDQLSVENGKTILSITDDVGSYEGVQKRYDRSVKGWDTILAGLKIVLATLNSEKN